MQGTVKDFDAATGSGSVLLDDGREVAFDGAAFAAGGLPLLDRVKFRAIFASNLDEFYMVRVAGLKRRQSTGLSVRSPDGLSTREQLARIGERTQALVQRHAACFLGEVGPALEAEGIR